MSAYRAMLRPESNAADGERQQAAKNLTDLEAKWPGPPPAPAAPPPPAPPPPDPAQEARRAKEREEWEERKRQRGAEEERRAMQQVIERQRAQVLGIPFWMLDPHFVRLHAAETPWTAEEHVLFDRRRKENNGGPDRDVAYVAAAIVTLGKAWGDPALREPERGWVEQELKQIATLRTRVSGLAALWIRTR